MVARAIHARARFALRRGKQERKLAVISMRNIMAVGAIVLLFVLAIVAPAPAREPCRHLLGASLVSIANEVQDADARPPGGTRDMAAFLLPLVERSQR